MVSHFPGMLLSMETRGRLGFSLLELLIAIVILSALSFTLINVYSEVYNVLSKNFSVIPRNLINFWKFKQSINSIYTFVYENKNEPGEFFKKKDDEMYFVSDYSATDLTPPVLCHLFKKDDKLILTEIPVYSSKVNYLTLKYEKQNLEKKNIEVMANVVSVKISIKRRSGEPATKIPSYVYLHVKLKSGRELVFQMKVKAYNPNQISTYKSLISQVF